MYYKNDTIIIREFTPQELHLFLDLFTNENVTRYLPYKSPEEFKQMFEKALLDYKEGSLSRWGIFDAQNGAFVGVCLARIFAENANSIEIGYMLGENYWGKGIGTQVCKALADYCLSADQEKEIVALTDLDNIGSQKVLLKSGFNRLENLEREDRALAYFLFSKEQ
ncbi:GNAT family N-acetyltransferase [Chryseobacterium sp. Marseille-Q3244]|uniref:GNAT family N-acetyltransferase n=1 Tax=Chryseobacterium sp. Marseille-Q3244 TaxID=2758092 RepID=UPI0020258229|nr:GNAT family N-acetyltransferase [Chryseobacterium sp. Marseille-Q3244]